VVKNEKDKKLAFVPPFSKQQLVNVVRQFACEKKRYKSQCKVKGQDVSFLFKGTIHDSIVNRFTLKWFICTYLVAVELVYILILVSPEKEIHLAQCLLVISSQIVFAV
jgi:hypothetical protein